ncbi:unnamed protein product [Closterium sp. Naga37s-1]|nr:unnamed protein product [Closterium sp. Naga37s-1]
MEPSIEVEAAGLRVRLSCLEFENMRHKRGEWTENMLNFAMVMIAREKLTAEQLSRVVIIPMMTSCAEYFDKLAAGDEESAGEVDNLGHVGDAAEDTGAPPVIDAEIVALGAMLAEGARIGLANEHQSVTDGERQMMDREEPPFQRRSAREILRGMREAQQRAPEDKTERRGSEALQQRGEGERMEELAMGFEAVHRPVENDEQEQGQGMDMRQGSPNVVGELDAEVQRAERENRVVYQRREARTKRRYDQGREAREGEEANQRVEQKRMRLEDEEREERAMEGDREREERERKREEENEREEERKVEEKRQREEEERKREEEKAEREQEEKRQKEEERKREEEKKAEREQEDKRQRKEEERKREEEKAEREQEEKRQKEEERKREEEKKAEREQEEKRQREEEERKREEKKAEREQEEKRQREDEERQREEASRVEREKEEKRQRDEEERKREEKKLARE